MQGELAGTYARRIVCTDGRCSGATRPRGANARRSSAQKAQEGKEESTQILLPRQFAGAAGATCVPGRTHGRMPLTNLRLALLEGPKSSDPELLTRRVRN